MGGEGLVDAGQTARLLTGRSHRVPGDGLAEALAGEEPIPRARPAPVTPQLVKQLHREHHIAVFAPLALVDPQHHARTIDVGDLQVRGLAHAQSGAVGDHENGAVLEAYDAAQEPGHLFAAQDDGQRVGFLRQRNVRKSPITPQGHGVEKTQRRRGDRDTARRKLPGIQQMHLIGAYLLGAKEFGRAGKVFGKGSHLQEIGLLGIPGKVADTHILEQALTQWGHGWTPGWYDR